MRVLAAALVLAGVSACGGGSPQATHPAGAHTAARKPARATTSATTVTTSPQPAPQPKPRVKPTPSPGSLPQTAQLPSAATPTFQAEMQALWAGVQHSAVARAMPAFFPEGAYAQVKAIPDPQSDFAGRLVADYGLDLAAAHALLGANPGAAQLVGVQVPQSYAHWIASGVCANRVGYYEVPNARVIYRAGGQIRSFGIASMISWRGVWYVIHLGAILRPGAGGVVDDPSPGTGVSAPSSTC